MKAIGIQQGVHQQANNAIYDMCTGKLTITKGIDSLRSFLGTVNKRTCRMQGSDII